MVAMLFQAEARLFIHPAGPRQLPVDAVERARSPGGRPPAGAAGNRAAGPEPAQNSMPTVNETLALHWLLPHSLAR